MHVEGCYFSSTIYPVGHRSEYTALCSQISIVKPFQEALNPNHTASELIAR